MDLSKLNKFVKRERYQSPTPHEAVADIAASQAEYFIKFDALSGYWQCPLSNESQHLTNCITPFGRYMFQRAPFRICSNSEYYNKRMNQAMAGNIHVRKIVDDVIAIDSNYTSHVRHVRSILQICVEKEIPLKREKFVFAQKEATFCGYVVSGNRYCIHPHTAQV